MVICITAEGKTLDSKVDSRFGRSTYFILYDTETGNVEAVENPNIQFSGGAGIQSAQLMITKGVKAVVTGNVGPNAFGVLTQAGIDAYVGANGPVREAIDHFKSGKLKKADSPGPGKQSKGAKL
ncbi:MAG: NifB/NifX family molybdenum-iron cluster-binding protein [Candidatus Omnitrophica bacterium]|nr:NifB/NifX family molybdenum-iron cluster-binding protein [Candidatus Omnitrophota bacterium]